MLFKHQLMLWSFSIQIMVFVQQIFNRSDEYEEKKIYWIEEEIKPSTLHQQKRAKCIDNKL